MSLEKIVLRSVCCICVGGENIRDLPVEVCLLDGSAFVWTIFRTLGMIAGSTRTPAVWVLLCPLTVADTPLALLPRGVPDSEPRTIWMVVVGSLSLSLGLPVASVPISAATAASATASAAASASALVPCVGAGCSPTLGDESFGQFRSDLDVCFRRSNERG